MPTRDDYFDHNFVPGLLTQMILARRKACPESNPDFAELKTIFITAGCPGAASMIEWLGSAQGKIRGLKAFGSGTIPLEGQAANLPLNLMDFGELYIGCGRFHLTALEWLCYFARDVNMVPTNVREVVSNLCQFALDHATGKTKTTPVNLADL